MSDSAVGRRFTIDGAPILRRLLEARGWRSTDRLDWDLYWRPQVPGRALYRHLERAQRVNHVPGVGSLTSPRLLARTLRSAGELLSARQGAWPRPFHPPAYVLPRDRDDLAAAAAAAPRGWTRTPLAPLPAGPVEPLEDVAALPVDDECLVRRAIPTRHVIGGSAYTLRLLVLITCADPLRVYLAPVGAVLPGSGAPLSLRAYRALLQDEGAGDDALWDALRARVRAAAIAAQRDLVDAGACLRRVDSAFELLAFDFAVDADLAPWLLRCRVSPPLAGESVIADAGESAEEAEERLLVDVLRTAGVIDAPTPQRPRGWSERRRPAGDEEIAAATRDEIARCGALEPLLPCDDVHDVVRLFPFPRRADVVAACALAGRAAAPAVRLRPRRAEHHFVGRSVVVYAETSRRYHLLNETAGYIWIRLTDGAAPDEIARELVARFPDSADLVREDVWTSLAVLVRDGLAAPVGDVLPEVRPRRSDRPRSRVDVDLPRDGTCVDYLLRGCRLRVGCPDVAVREHLDDALGNLAAPPDAAPATALSGIVAHRGGYELHTDDGRVQRVRDVSYLAPRLRAFLLRRTYELEDGLITIRGAAVERDGRAVLLCGRADAGKSLLAAALCARGLGYVCDDAAVVERGGGRVLPLPVGLQLLEEDAERLAATHPGLGAGRMHRLPSEFGVRYLAPPAAAATVPLDVRALVFTSYAGGSKSYLGVLDAHEALARLTRGGIDVVPELDAERARELVDWVCARPAFELLVGDLEEAADLLDLALSRGAPA